MAVPGLHSLVPVTPVGPVACGSRLWRHDGNLHLTLIAKASFKLMPNATMRLLPRPAPIVVKDRQFRDNPSRSVIAASDMDLMRHRCDVVYLGSVYTKGNQPVGVRNVRLALHRGRQSLVDKTLHIVGDRRREPTATISPPEPFRRLPLIYERAYGGIGYEANPLGLGHGPGQESGRQPNILDPKSPERTACYAPLSRAWPTRRGLLGDFKLRQFNHQIVRLPDDFNFEFFQTAPTDQRIAYPVGGETLRLEGLTPGGGEIESTLPRTRVLIQEAASHHLTRMGEFALDALLIDGASETCSMTWRAVATLPSFQALDGLGILMALEVDGESISWPDEEALVAKVTTSDDAYEEPLFDEPILVETTFHSAETHIMDRAEELDAAELHTLHEDDSES